MMPSFGTLFLLVRAVPRHHRSSRTRSASCASTSGWSCSASAGWSASAGPGLVLLIPIIDRAVKVGLRTVTMDVPPQDIITKDNVSVKVNAVIYFRVIDAQQAIVAGRELPLRHLADRPDHAALDPRPAGAGRAAAPSARS